MPTLYLSTNALVENYRLLKARTNGALIPVLKADAYGHGALLALNALLAEGAELFAVATAFEALELLEFIKKSKYSFTKTSVLIMGSVEEEALPSLLPYLPSVIFSVHSPTYARRLSDAVSRMKAACLLPPRVTLPVHLKLETGMHRLGLRTEGAISFVTSLPHLNVLGAYSHFACPENETRARAQHRRFLSLLAPIDAPLFTHLSASGGLLLHGDLGLSAVRVGLALYGIPPVGCSLPLTPVMRFSARVLSVLSVKAGTYVGYGSFRVAKRSRLAVIDAGYADGVPPSAEMGGFVTVKSKKCPFVGAVCMDRATLDVSDVPISEGEEITLFGEASGDAARFAEAAGTSPYVLLCLRSSRTRRVIL